MDEAKVPAATGTPTGTGNAHPSLDQRYAAAVQLVVHAENTSGMRIYNFLMGASITMLAWATVFAGAQDGNCWRTGTLALMSVAGLLLSIAWMPFGWRGRRFVDAYLDVARELEGGADPAPVSRGNEITFSLPLKIFRARYLAVAVPLVFAGVFATLLVVSLRQ
ncbi:MAG: hypothetical protein AAB262_14035 [Elusimicrobiota bacterium]